MHFHPTTYLRTTRWPTNIAAMTGKMARVSNADHSTELGWKNCNRIKPRKAREGVDSMSEIFR